MLPAAILPHCYKIHRIDTLTPPKQNPSSEEAMAGAAKSSRIIFLLPLLLLGATASPLPPLNSSVANPDAVVADFHRYLIP
jgi:hypothetical protein